MKILDSSFCSDFLRGREEAKQYRLDHRQESLLLPSVGFYELYYGAQKVGRDPTEVDRDIPWVERIEYRDRHAREAARIRDELTASGERIQHPDMMLAGVARSIGVPIVTSDTGFEQIENLKIENPRKMY